METILTTYSRTFLTREGPSTQEGEALRPQVDSALSGLMVGAGETSHPLAGLSGAVAAAASAAEVSEDSEAEASREVLCY